VALWVGKLAARAISVISPDRGTNKSGEIACRLMPGFIGGFRGIDPATMIFTTGTNGKSTTNNLIVHAFRTAGHTVATNLEGANLIGGVATTLVKNSTLGGKLKPEYLILEVDERTLPKVRASLPARNLCVTNIQKDQVQRNGDPDYIYRTILSAVDSSVTMYVNNEEPRTAALGRAAGRTVSFSVAQNERHPNVRDDGFAVTLACPVCHDALGFDYLNLPNVGKFTCPSCGFASSDQPDYQVDSVDYAGGRFSVNGVAFKLRYEAAHFLYDYVLCCAVAREAGISWEDLQRSFDTFTNADGRLERFQVGQQEICYTRIKQENPETLQSSIDYIATQPGRKVVILGLQLIHDVVPHYTNTAYAFDCDFEALFAGDVEACICFGETNCYEAGTRLVYAGFPPDKIRYVDSDQPGPILAALAKCQSERAYLITMIGQYIDIHNYARRKGAK